VDLKRSKRKRILRVLGDPNGSRFGVSLGELEKEGKTGGGGAEGKRKKVRGESFLLVRTKIQKI